MVSTPQLQAESKPQSKEGLEAGQGLTLGLLQESSREQILPKCLGDDSELQTKWLPQQQKPCGETPARNQDPAVTA